MKKFLVSVMFLGLLGFAANSQAQNAAGDFGIGVGVAYGFDIEEIGINAGVQYSFTNDIRTAFDFTYYLADEGITWWEANVNAHYFFVNDEALRLYALAGVQYAYWEIEFMGISVDDSEVGFNVGAGLEYNLGGVSIFVEPKFTINGFEQLNVTGGVRLSF